MKTRSSTDFYAPLHAERFYHVYNRTNNKELLFIDDMDRWAFLQRFDRFLYPFMDIYAYCLMDTHFHLLIKVKNVAQLSENVELIPKALQKKHQKHFLEPPFDDREAPKLLEGQFHQFFTSYPMYFNIRHQRKGNLFTRQFRRIEIDNEAQRLYNVYYIHANPVKHGIRNEFETYPWSSYQLLLSNEPTSIARTETLRWFGGKDEFVKFHRERHRENGFSTERISS